MSETGYFPYRALKNRPYIAEFQRLPEKDRGWDTMVQMALSRTRRSFGEREVINADKKLSQVVHACCMHESWLATALAGFFDGGQVVFHLSPVLKEAFRHSELGDATVSDLKFPFMNAYIHIGTDLGLVFNGGRTQLEGVLMSKNNHKDGDSVSMTIVGTLLADPEHWGERGLETFSFHFSPKEMDLPILEGAKIHLEHQGLDPTEDDALSDLSQFDEEARKNILDSWSTQAEERRLHRENIPVVLECVRMVANALLYVSQYPDDMADDYQDGFPKGFREKIERSQGQAQARTLSKARNSGFTLIKRVGGTFERAMLAEASLDKGMGDSPSPHLRRAHWRRQAHGVGLTLRKLIWIRVARVLGGTVRERPYLISNGVVEQPTPGSNLPGSQS